MRFWNF
ncbi:hypothetical protein LINPERPRIM_LOCUS9245 [Linum perenne]